MTEDGMIELFTQRAVKGMEYLDEHCPGWIDKIDLGILSMANMRTCIIGQLFGEYWTYVKVGGIFRGNVPEHHQPFDYGFDIDGMDGEHIERPYSALADVWDALITERREA